MEILYEDRDAAVCVKPVGLDSEKEVPAALTEALGGDFFPIHRLDRNVGGVMVFARSRKAAALLSAQVRERQFSKGYLAVVHGVPQPPAGQLRDLLGRDSVRRVTFVADTPSAETREALLDYETLESSGSLSLVQVHLHTGRTHQIRVQFASRGMPLWGDRKYGLPEEDASPLALWACQLSFTHPQTGKEMAFTSLPPEIEPWTQFARIKHI